MTVPELTCQANMVCGRKATYSGSSPCSECARLGSVGHMAFLATYSSGCEDT